MGVYERAKNGKSHIKLQNGRWANLPERTVENYVKIKFSLRFLTLYPGTYLVGLRRCSANVLNYSPSPN